MYQIAAAFTPPYEKTDADIDNACIRMINEKITEDPSSDSKDSSVYT